MDGRGFGLLLRAVAVTIIHTLQDWRVIELWTLMEFLRLRARKLEFHICMLKKVLDASAAYGLIGVLIKYLYTTITLHLIQTKGWNQFLFLIDIYGGFFSLSFSLLQMCVIAEAIK